MSTTTVRSPYSLLKPSHTIPSDLPIYTVKERFTSSMNDPSVQIITVKGATGCGKSVGITTMLGESNHLVMVTVPTKVGVYGLYSFIRDNCNIGRDIGYAFDGDVKYQYNTKLKIATTKHGFNCLKKAISRNKPFPNNFVFVLDEAHHTTQENAATLKLAQYALRMGILKKLIVMSATFGLTSFDDFTNVTLEAEGRMFPITTFWNSFDICPNNFKRFATHITNTIVDLIKANPNEGILVFVSGEKEVEEVSAYIEDNRALNAEVFRLYSKMPADELNRSLEPVIGKTKVVVATNIAESSVTISDISVVVDTCVKKTPYENERFGILLKNELISQSNSLQRRGRAGRTKEGKYYPMITEEKWEDIDTNDSSDMDRLSPYGIVLELLNEQLPARSILQINSEKYDRIINKLLSLKLMTESGEDGEKTYHITQLGRAVQQYPFSLENSIVAFKSSSSVTGSGQDHIRTIVTLILVSMIEGSQGNSFFWIPKEHRKNKNMYKEFMEDQFGHMKGSNDLETYLYIFSSMFHEPKSHKDAAVAKWAKTNSMNNKLLKNARRNFSQLIRITYPKYRGYAEDFLENMLEQNGIHNLAQLVRDDVLSPVYELFEDVYSDCVFNDPEEGMYGIAYHNNAEVPLSHKIDTMRSFSRLSTNVAHGVVALQVVESVYGLTTNRYISCVFPCKVKKENGTDEEVTGERDTSEEEWECAI